MPQLIVKNQSSNEERVYNLPQDVITIGRISSCDIELAEKSISRKHTEIIREGEDYFLVDLKSGNGTFLNGKKIRPIEKQLLRPKDVIKIENYEITFSNLEESVHIPGEDDTDTDIIEVKMIKKVLGSLNKESAPSLEVLNGEAEGRKVFFTDDLQEVQIGRDPKCHLGIDDPVLSRHHAKLTKKWGGIVLVDQGSRNGCYVNNEKVTEKLLRDGDKVMLGTIKLIYRNPQDINIEAISEEISRKKKEAAIREVEQQELEEKRKAEEAAEAERVEKEEQERLERERAEAEKAQAEAQAAAEQQALKEQAQNRGGAPTSFLSSLSTLEKVLIGAGALIFILVLAAIVGLLV